MSTKLARQVVVLALVGAVSFLGVGAAGALDAKVCKPKAAKKCKKPIAKRKAKKPVTVIVTTTTPPSTPSGPTINFDFGASVTDAWKAELKSDLESGLKFFTTFGAPSDVLVNFYAGSTDELVKRYVNVHAPITEERAKENLGPDPHQAAAREIWFGTSGLWTGYDTATRAHAVIHESFHVVQNAIFGGLGINFGGSPDAVPAGGPAWLIEGSAEQTAYAATASLGLTSLGTTNATRDANARRTSATLQSMETYNGMAQTNADVTYAVSALAVDLLTRDKGMASLVKFWTDMHGRRTWQSAFADAFGITPADFYAKFEDYRKSV